MKEKRLGYYSAMPRDEKELRKERSKNRESSKNQASSFFSFKGQDVTF
jgi:hypothetical protein